MRWLVFPLLVSVVPSPDQVIFVIAVMLTVWGCDERADGSAVVSRASAASASPEEPEPALATPASAVTPTDDVYPSPRLLERIVNGRNPFDTGGGIYRLVCETQHIGGNRLTAITSSAGEPQAWFVNEQTGGGFVVGPGDSIDDKYTIVVIDSEQLTYRHSDSEDDVVRVVRFLGPEESPGCQYVCRDLANGCACRVGDPNFP